MTERTIQLLDATAPLHPLTHVLRSQVPDGSVRQEQAWRARGLGNVTALADMPLVASSALWDGLNDRVASMCHQLKPLMHAEADSVWGPLPVADVLCLDFAIVRAATPQGWEVQCVELQAFTSIVSTVQILQELAHELWPMTTTLRHHDALPVGKDWATEARAWMCPVPDSALMELAPWQQKTSFDFRAAQRLFDIPVIDTNSLRRHGHELTWQDSGGFSHPLKHVFNRLIAHTLPQFEALQLLLRDVPLSWHSHPEWYYRVGKAQMAGLVLSAEERVVPAHQWRVLGMPADKLVLKAAESYGGTDVLLHVTAEQLDTLPNAARWLVQPRFEPLPVLTASDGAPLFAEVRCVVARPTTDKPWVATRFARVYRGDKASASTHGAQTGSGLALLFSPPVP